LFSVARRNADNQLIKTMKTLNVKTKEESVTFIIQTVSQKTDEQCGKYGFKTCIDAYKLHLEGFGADTISSMLFPIFNGNAEMAEAAIDAGRELMFDQSMESLKPASVEPIATATAKLEMPIYESPALAMNLKRFGHDENACICCGRPMKEGESKLIHMTTSHTALHNSIKNEADALALGFDSQLYFPIGNSCAKKMPKEFIHG